VGPWLIISGALALLGGGAGAYAWYQENYGSGAAAAAGPGSGLQVDPDQDPTTNSEGYVNLSGGAIAQVNSSGVVTQISAGVVSPYVNPGRSTVVTAPTSSPPSVTAGAAAGALAGGLFSGSAASTVVPPTAAHSGVAAAGAKATELVF
jgi:hypothetical protein